MIIECEPDERELKLKQMILPHGYAGPFRVGVNLLFVHAREAEIIERGKWMIVGG